MSDDEGVLAGLDGLVAVVAVLRGGRPVLDGEVALEAGDGPEKVDSLALLIRNSSLVPRRFLPEPGSFSAILAIDSWFVS